MTQQGVMDLYMYMMASWPTQVKTWHVESFQKAKIQELYKTYKEYGDAEVLGAFQKWAENEDKFPTTKNILTELKWARALKENRRADPAERYSMEIIDDEGNEYMVMWNGKAAFTLEEFVNMPRNKDHIGPEEWERRFKARRKRILYGKPLQEV